MKQDKKDNIRLYNPSIMGQITELKCQLFFIEHGFNVLVPLGNHQKYDLVLEHNNIFTRIQIKHATSHNDGKSFVVKTKYQVRDVNKTQRVSQKNYTLNDCDCFMTEFNNQFYIFPIFGTNETKFWLNDEDVKLKSQHKASDYIAEDYLQNL